MGSKTMSEATAEVTTLNQDVTFPTSDLWVAGEARVEPGTWPGGDGK